MAKKTKRPWEGDIGITPAAFFTRQIEARQSDLGRTDIIVGSEAQRIVLGLPLRALSLRYGFANDVFPLSRMTELYGMSESCKTAMLFEMFRWHIFGEAVPMNPIPSRELEPVGGFGFMLAEPRDSPDLRSSIIGHGFDEAFPAEPCNSIEDWQDGCTRWMKQSRATFSEVGSMPFPAALGVDSLTGVTTRDAIAKIWEKGHAERQFAVAAALINDYCKFLFNELRVWPISFIGTNHMKISKDARGFIERRIPGGSSLDFYATFKMRMARKDDIEHLDDYGRLIHIVWDKNSLSAAGERRELKVHMRWVFDENNVQHTWWDWHDATVELLLSHDGTRKNRIMDICQIEGVDKGKRKADCPTLGLKKATYAEIGEAIEQDDGVRNALDQLFGVRKRRQFVPGIPYIQQVRDAMAEDPAEVPAAATATAGGAEGPGWGGEAES